MLKVSIRRIKPEKEEQLRKWLSVLNSRSEEVRETFKEESVRAEQAYILAEVYGPVLVYVMEAEDFEKGAKAYADSTLPIDQEHRTVMKECLGESLGLDPQYDVTLLD